MSFRRTAALSLAFSLPAIFIGIATGLSPDAVVNGAAAAAGLFSAVNYRPS